MSDIIQFSRGAKTVSATSLGSVGMVYADIKMSDIYDGSQSNAETNASPNTVAPLELKPVPPALLADTSQGWSNQELSDFYRTHRLLALAGIATEVDHGLTDEGHPWCVFLDGQNEVFVHFSRFDGVYLVSSQVQEKPVWGDSLAGLVTEFSKMVQPATQTGSERGSVISIAGRSRNTVMIHPAAALAALVWSIYLMSDELVAAIPPVAHGLGDDHPQTNLSDAVLDIETLPDVAQKAMIALINPTLAKLDTKQDADPYHGREISVGTQIAHLSSGLSMKAVGLGLSFAALSVGLPLINSVSTDTSPETSGLNIDQLHTVVSDIKAIALSVEVSILEFQTSHEELHNAVENTMPMALTKIAIEVGESPVDVSMKMPTSYEVKSAPFSSFQDKSATPVLEVAEATSDAPLPQSVRAANSFEDNKKLVSTDLLQRFDEAYTSFELTSLNTLDQSEFVQLVTVNELTELIDVLEDYSQTGQYGSFDDNARLYLNFLLENYDSIKVVTLPNEIIFVHVDAFDSADINHAVYSKSWSFDDGSTISTVGLKSDMEMFHLIA